jgi:hypothetical protein
MQFSGGSYGNTGFHHPTYPFYSSPQNKEAPELRKAGALLTYEKHHFPV